MPSGIRGRILWIEDDHQTVGDQVSRLQKNGIEVDLVDTIDEAVIKLRQPTSAIDGVIVDIMMATGSYLADSAAASGLLTGVSFLEKLSAEGLLDRYRWMVYTITNNPETQSIQDRFQISVYKKQMYPGKLIVELVEDEFFSQV